MEDNSDLLIWLKCIIRRRTGVKIVIKCEIDVTEWLLDHFSGVMALGSGLPGKTLSPWTNFINYNFTSRWVLSLTWCVVVKVNRWYWKRWKWNVGKCVHWKERKRKRWEEMRRKQQQQQQQAWVLFKLENSLAGSERKIVREGQAGRN